MKRGRPSGPKKSDKVFQLLESQVEYLEALIDLAPVGKPTFVSVVRQAVGEYIARAMAKPEVRDQVETYLKKSPQVVKLHDVKNGKK